MRDATKLKFRQLYQYEASKELHKLAEAPYDLTQPHSLSRERIEQFQASACGLRLLYSLERVDSRTMSALERLASEADLIDKMKSMQAGEVINRIEGYPSEERAVLHTALRDVFSGRQHEGEAHAAAKLAAYQLQELEKFCAEIDEKNEFDDLLFIGIGGSELGPKMLYEALQGWRKENRRVHFISNVDPDEVAQKVQGLNLKRTLMAVVSKSGGTMETATNEALVRERFGREGLDASKQAIVITVPGSPMDDPQRFWKRFHMWDWVGGRYCATSCVGGVAVGFAMGFKVFKDFLRGAHEMDQAACERDLRHNLPLLSALLGLWNRNFLHYPTLAIIPYSQMLWRFAAHIQQLDMESNGKRIDRYGEPIQGVTGPVIWGEPATNAQHSFFQLIHQGTDVIPIEFIGFRESQWGEDLEIQGTSSQDKLVANMLAQGLALATGKSSDNPNKNFPGNRPSSLLLGARLEPHTLGAILAYYEHKVDFQGFAMGINSFDQEGVQLGKKLAVRILDLMKSRRSGVEGEPFEVGEALLDELNWQ